MNIILIFLIAVSLSMDAFSLSIAYGTMSLTKREINTLSIIVGLYHFIMPIFGMLIGNFVLNILNINNDVIILIIFSLIGINMIFEAFKNEEKIKRMKLLEMLSFGFAVSLDSFSIGIGLHNLTSNVVLSSLVFSLTSMSFTYVGLIFGKKLNQYFGKYATILGGILLIIIGIIYG